MQTKEGAGTLHPPHPNLRFPLPSLTYLHMEIGEGGGLVRFFFYFFWKKKKN